MFMPRKIAGIAIKTMDMSIDAIKVPIVVLDSATHLYCTIEGHLEGFCFKLEDYKKIT
jgi:hypothetical protein